MSNTESDAQAYVDSLVTDMMALKEETATPVRAQHLVSQVLLARFTERLQDGERLQPFDLDHPTWFQKPKTTAAVGYEQHFVRFASASLEQLWNDVVENRLRLALAAVDDNVLFDHAEHVDVLRDCLALHLVRSYTYREIQAQSFRDAERWALERFLGPMRGAVEEYVLRNHGLHLAGAGGVEFYARRFIADIVRAQEGHEVLRVRIERQFEQVRAFMRTAGMRIFVAGPEAGDFLVGDTPAITATHGPGALPARAPLLKARLVGMPLGPRHLMALSWNSGYEEADAGTVEVLNALQVARARRFVYFRPGSNMGPWVERASVELRDPAAAS